MNFNLHKRSKTSKRTKTFGIVIPRNIKGPMNPVPSLPQVDFNTLLRRLSEADRELAMERVAIMEYEGGLTRAEAEQNVIAEYAKKIPIQKAIGSA